MLALDLPLVMAVVLVTFITGYIPSIGAFPSGAFAFLIALGASGMEDALIILTVILFAQNVIQTVVGNKFVSDKLSMHPIVSFASTIVGATVAGALGAALGPPLLAAFFRITSRIRSYYGISAP